MMVETILESSQDFGMSNGPGGLPQWKRELLQRRAARSRPAAAPPPAPPPRDLDDDEELRYGPGIVKRLKSRYLSLALRDAPRRRASVLRRAASLEHLLDERPPPAPRPPAARPPRPASLAAPPGAARSRDFIKRARSVDALSRLEARDEPHPPSLSPPPPSSAVAPPPPSAITPPPPSTIAPSPPSTIAPPPFSAIAPSPPSTIAPPPPSAIVLPPASPPPVVPPPTAPSPIASSPASPPPTSPVPTAPPPPAPRPPLARSSRPPRKPAPLLRETERPPPDVVRLALRKFESAPARRGAPAARVSAVLRGLEGAPRTSTPEPRSPSPAAPRDEPEAAPAAAEPRAVSRAALESIARAGSSVRFAFEAPRAGSHLPPLAAANLVLVGRARRVGVIRPMPAPTLGRAPPSPPPPADVDEKLAEPAPRPPTPPTGAEPPPPRAERREPPPSALVEPIVRAPPEPAAAARPESPRPSRDATPEPARPGVVSETEPAKPLMNGHADPCKAKVASVLSRLGGADVERAWNGSMDRKPPPAARSEPAEEKPAPWARRGAGRGARAAGAAAGAVSVVFNFSDRKEVPDYIENDGLVLRGSRRNRIKAGEPGVVVLHAGARADSGSESSGDEGPPSPCGVRFVNDNVLINGRSSMPARPDRLRQAKLKLQFDDSLTRTFEYPSETSLCEDAPPPAAHDPAALADNTHIVPGALARYTPAKTRPAEFELGVSRCEQPAPAPHDGDEAADEDAAREEGALRPCGADGRAWSEARALRTDLLF